jgi:hypothetical protein
MKGAPVKNGGPDTHKGQDHSNRENMHWLARNDVGAIVAGVFHSVLFI